MSGRLSITDNSLIFGCVAKSYILLYFQIIASRNDQKKTVVQKSCDVDLLTETDQEVEKLLMSNLSNEFPTHR